MGFARALLRYSNESGDNSMAPHAHEISPIGQCALECAWRATVPDLPVLRRNSYYVAAINRDAPSCNPVRSPEERATRKPNLRLGGEDRPGSTTARREALHKSTGRRFLYCTPLDADGAPHRPRQHAAARGIVSRAGPSAPLAYAASLLGDAAQLHHTVSFCPAMGNARIHYFIWEGGGEPGRHSGRDRLPTCHARVVALRLPSDGGPTRRQAARGPMPLT